MSECQIDQHRIECHAPSYLLETKVFEKTDEACDKRHQHSITVAENAHAGRLGEPRAIPCGRYKQNGDENENLTGGNLSHMVAVRGGTRQEDI